MAVTGNIELNPAEKKYLFRKKMYEEYQESFLLNGAQGQGSACVELIKELSKNSKGEEAAFIPQLPVIRGGGIIGNNTARHRERKVKASWDRVNYDCFANAIVTEGPVSDQKSLIQLRSIYRPVLGRWLGESSEEQAILTAAGVSYGYNTDLSARVTPDGQDDWIDLDYAADVSNPTANRVARYVGASHSFVPGTTSAIINPGAPSNTSIAAGDVVDAQALPEMKQLMIDAGIQPCRIGGRDVHLCLAPTKFWSRLMKDNDFRRDIVLASDRGSKNALLRYGVITQNDLLIVPTMRGITTRGAASGSKWGAAGTVEGCRVVGLGAQALARADLGIPDWREQKDDYDRVSGFYIEHMGGWKKVKFESSLTGTTEDYATFVFDFAL